VVEGRAGARVWINDPATGPRVITAREFDEAFTGVLLTFAPKPDFQPGGHAPALIGAIRERLAGFGVAVAAVTIAGFLLVAPGLVIPGLQRAFIDYYLIAGLHDWLWWLIGGIAAIAVLKGLLVYFQQRTLARFQVRFAVATTGRLLWQILHLPIAFFTQRNPGELAGRVGIGDRLTGLLSGSVTVTIVNLLAITIYAAVMVTYDVPLAVMVVVFAALNLSLLLWLSRRLADAHQRMLQDDGRMQAMMLQGFANMETYRASGTEGLFFRRWAGAHARVVSAEQAMAFWQRLLSSLPIMLTTIAGVCIVLLGGMRVMEGTITIGMLIAFQAIMFNFNAPVTGVIGLSAQLQQTRGYIDRLGDVMNQQLDPLLRTEKKADLPAPRGALDLDHLSFGYAAVNAPFLRDVSLHTAPGGRIALTGPSGSGKSTLGRLIVGLLMAREGAIRLDDVDIMQLPGTVLRSSVSYVDQTTSLFAGTVRDNITMWDATITDERMVAAAKDAMIHDMIAARPNAYETRVDENGRNFSGGERQRLSIARALAVDPVLVVFDEATSALDAVVEKAIFDNIRRRGCTCVLISHRLSAMRDCDEIVVLENGQILERGRHGTLMVNGKRYPRLVEV